MCYNTFRNFQSEREDKDQVMQRYRFLLIADTLTKNELTEGLTQSGQETVCFSGNENELSAVASEFLPHMVILSEAPAVKASERRIKAVRERTDSGIMVISKNARELRRAYMQAGADIVIGEGSSAIEMISKTNSYLYENEKRIVPARPEVTYSAEVFERVCAALGELEITPNYCGYAYIRDMIVMLIDSPDKRGAMTKSIYPGIAKRYDTNSACVERGVRTVVRKSWQKMMPETKIKYFGVHSQYMTKCPTNSCYVFTIAERIARQIRLDSAVVV